MNDLSESPKTINESPKQGNSSQSVLIPKLGDENTSTNIDVDSTKLPKKVKSKMNRKLKVFLIGLSGLVVLVLLFFSAIGLMGYRVYKDALNTRDQVDVLVAVGRQQDLPRIKSEIENTKVSIAKLNLSYGRLLFLSGLPVIGEYINDGQHGINAGIYGLEAGEIVVQTIEPYADIIGLAPSVDEASSGEETAQDRLDFVVNTIPSVIPQADLLSEKMELVRLEVDQIDPNRYPVEIRGILVRDRLKRGIELVDMASQLITNGKPLLKVAPDILGTNRPRKYLIIFQNDKELRPTGGFLTAYSIAIVEKGKFSPVSSNDIYNLDNQYRPVIPAPEPIKRLLKAPYVLSPNLRLRDMNWSPDYSLVMDMFIEEIKKVGVTDLDGIIAVDTQAVVNLLDVIGPIGVPGYGEFSTDTDPRCNCPQVVYELESFADVEGSVVWDQNDPTKIIFAPDNYENRKVIIGPMMNSILSNALGQSKEKIPSLFEAGFKSLLEKHVLFYLTDDAEQKAVEDFGIAGRVKDFDGDYLHIVDANLGGRKSNLYVTQRVEQEIDVSKDGDVTKTVTLTYTNTEKHDGWLNSVLPSWVRIYVPEGSQLIEMQGLERSTDPYTEIGKTVFAGQYSLRPEGVVKITFTYTLPFKVTGDKYEMMIQKQSGTDNPLHIITIGNKTEEFFLKTDREFAIAR